MDYGHSTDGQLLEAFSSQGDQEAFAELVGRHKAMVLGICLRIVQSPPDAEDAAQAVFIALACKASKLRKDRSAGAWLHHVACQASLDVREARNRRVARRKKVAAMIAQLSPQVSEQELQELRDTLDLELDRLPTKYRQALVLHYFEGLNQEQTAQRLGCKVGTLSSQLHRGREMLRKRLVKRGLVLTGSALGAAMVQTTAASLASAAAAIPSASFVGATVQAASLAACGGLPGAAGIISCHVAAIAKGALHSMFIAKIKAVAAGVAAAAALTAAVAVTAANLDLYGDPLPTGASARLGSVRFRQGGAIEAIALSPDGKYLASASRDNNTTTLWEVATGKELWSARFGDMSRSVAFSGDGKLLAASGQDGTVKVWQTVGGKEVQKISEPGQRFTCIAISADGKYVGGTSAAHRSKPAKVWEVETGKLTWTFEGDKPATDKDIADLAYAIAFSPDGKLAATMSTKALRLWDMASGKSLGTFPGGYPAKLAFSPDSRKIASTANTDLRVIDIVAQNDIFNRAASGLGAFHCVAFAPDGNTVATGNLSGQVTVWDLKAWEKDKEEKKSPTVIQAHSAYVGGVAFSADGKMLASGGWDGAIRFWDPVTGKELSQHGGSKAPIATIAFSNDGKLIATGNGDGTFCLWDAATSREIARGGGPREPAAVRFSPDGNSLAIAGRGHVLAVWDVEKRKERFRTAASSRGQILNLTFDALGGKIAMMDLQSTTLSIWDAATGQLAGSLTGPEKYPGFTSALMTLSADGEIAAGKLYAPGVKQSDAAIRAYPYVVWETATGKEILELTLPASTPLNVALSPNGRMLAALSSTVDAPASSKQTEWALTVVDVLEGKKLHSTRTTFASGVAFSPDGRVVATSESPPAVQLRDAFTGRELRRFVGHKDKITCLAFSPDGRKIATGSVDSTVLVWLVPELKLVPASRPAMTRPAPADLEKLVKDLGNADASKAYKAMASLVAAGDEAVAEVARRVKPVVSDKKMIQEALQRARKILPELSGDKADVRKATSDELARIAEDLISGPREELLAVLQDALKDAKKAGNTEAEARLSDLITHMGSLMLVSSEAILGLRTVRTLEYIGSPKARMALEVLSRGEPDASLTAGAKAALARLNAGS